MHFLLGDSSICRMATPTPVCNSGARAHGDAKSLRFVFILNITKSRKSGWDPRTRVIVQWARSSRALTQEETKNLLKDCLSLKSCDPFTHALTPPFIGDEGTFPFRKYPWTQRIFLVWTFTQMSFTSYTFTSLPLVHTLNLDFLGRHLW
jgi:hypothetical protein